MVPNVQYYCTVRLEIPYYILGIIKVWVFLAKKITQKPVLQYHPGALAVLVRYNQAQKYFKYDTKCFQ